MNHYQDIASTMAAKRALFYSSSSSFSTTTTTSGSSSDDGSSSRGSCLFVDTALPTTTDIFREMDCEIEHSDDATASLRVVTRASPISESSSSVSEHEQEEEDQVDQELRLISPYPYSPTEEIMEMMELQQDNETRLITSTVDHDSDIMLPTELSREWAQDDMEECDDEFDIYHPTTTESATTNAFTSNETTNQNKHSSIYSFYFEAIPMEGEQQPQQDDEDDFTISSHDSCSFIDNEDYDGCLDNISSDPVAFWENGPFLPHHQTEERTTTMSPTQISLGSSSANDDMKDDDCTTDNDDSQR